MLCAVPAFRALRRALPEARISLLGLPWAASFVARFKNYLDEFIEFPGYPGLPEQECRPEALASLLQSLRKRRFSLALQMHGSGTVSNSVVEALGARFTAGFHPPGQQPPVRGWFAPYPAAKTEVERNLSLVRGLGFPAVDDRLEFPITADDARELSETAWLNGLTPRSYVCIHPGASRRDKCWPPDHFAKAASLIRRLGFTVVVTGNAGEADLAARISEQVEGCVDAASPGLGIGALALLIRDARLLVCNDTGVSHLASALEVPSIVVFSEADPGRWAPRDRDRHQSLGGNGRMPDPGEVLNAVRIMLS